MICCGLRDEREVNHSIVYTARKFVDEYSFDIEATQCKQDLWTQFVHIHSYGHSFVNSRPCDEIRDLAYELRNSAWNAPGPLYLVLASALLAYPEIVGITNHVACQCISD